MYVELLRATFVSVVGYSSSDAPTLIFARLLTFTIPLDDLQLQAYPDVLKADTQQFRFQLVAGDSSALYQFTLLCPWTALDLETAGGKAPGAVLVTSLRIRQLCDTRA
jgi:hypothetical protein